MDRMSPLDASFLHVEDGLQHMHIASCAVFEGPAPSEEEVLALIRGKLHLLVRYRQKVRFVPGAMGRPVWVDDPHFRVEYHVRRTALPAPGGEPALRKLMGRLMSQQLDRHRPLWEAWVVDGLEDGHWALISKVHHCMVDGISGTDLMTVLLDSSPDAVAQEPAPWQPQPEPTDAQLVADAMTELVRSPYEQARRLRSALRTPKRFAGQVATVADGIRDLGAHLTPVPPLSIEGPIGPHRCWAFARSTLAEVKQVRTALGGTVNDVVLAAITNGFRELLIARDDDVDRAVVRTLVPVSLRAPGDTTSNNQVSGVFANLPVGIADPVERLAAVRAEMDTLKHSNLALGLEAVENAAGLAPPALYAGLLRGASLLMRRTGQRSVTTVTTNVPGPRQPLYACGRRLLEYLPFVPLAQGVRVGVAILTYDGQVAFGITGDWDSVPEVDVVARGIEAGMEELLKAAAVAGAPT
jgi:diacylglycerol O-acyltransferase / wax synthase